MRKQNRINRVEERMRTQSNEPDPIKRAVREFQMKHGYDPIKVALREIAAKRDIGPPCVAPEHETGEEL
ncbi:hypothetical protein J2T55_000081 [Methylohalomonas lacus]|uniref:Uncharacterized protein n=1 Tax=Methylohalomonas lacus TaxID=398773 RepID=A0AAE3HGV3_9GAMM|nr:hypothetical protein [Methylohalomonas lacus]MCS3902089.1 hypothetical protein [Methylohalomonas lacus]